MLASVHRKKKFRDREHKCTRTNMAGFRLYAATGNVATARWHGLSVPIPCKRSRHDRKKKARLR